MTTRAGGPAPVTAPSTILVRTWPGLPPADTRPLAAAVVASFPTTGSPAMYAPPVPEPAGARAISSAPLTPAVGPVAAPVLMPANRHAREPGCDGAPEAARWTSPR